MVEEKNRRLYGYLVEAILIFLSVFAAFMLEARRSVDFERQSLVDELRAFKKDMASDSLYLGDFLFQKEIWSLHKDVFQPDSLILRMLLKNDPNLTDSIFYVWQASSSLRTSVDWFNLKYLAEWSNEQSGINRVLQYARFFSSDQLKSELRSYMHSRARINSYFNTLSERNQEVNFLLQTDYLLISIKDVPGPIRESIINEPIFQNSIRNEYRICKDIFEEVFNLLEDYEEHMLLIDEEIAYQLSNQVW